MAEMSQSHIVDGELKRIRIISNNIGYGPPPAPDEEVEQHVTINANGCVWFSAYNYGTEPGRYIRARAKAFKLPQDKCERIFRAFTAYFGNDYNEVFATDIGDWEMVLTNTEERTYRFRGSLCADFVSDGVDLSDLIRDSLSMNDLFVFDGNNKPDQIDRIQIDYHRITKIKAGAVPEGATWTHVTWDYSETLTIDRTTDTVEHQQIVGSGCKITRRYEVEGGVESILEGLDAEGLFSRIRGNPADVIETPNETKDYVITIDFKKGSQRTLSGSFDKNGLPEDYAEFIEPVFEFMAFYGFGEIFDPKSYNKVKRRTSELMYCGVRFDEGHRIYHYISDDDSIAEGDFVVVPAGKDDHHAVVEVVSVEYFSEENVPFPLDRTKSIIRKCDDSDFVEDDDDEYQVECPLTGTLIMETDCIEICDVVNDMLSPDVLEMLDPPLKYTDEVKQTCRGCKFHIGR